MFIKMVGINNQKHYVWTTDGNGAAGTLRLLNVLPLNSSALTTTSITYNSCGDEYLTGFGRIVLPIALGLLGIALLLVAIGMFYSIAKDMEII